MSKYDSLAMEWHDGKTFDELDLDQQIFIIDLFEERNE